MSSSRRANPKRKRDSTPVQPTPSRKRTRRSISSRNIRDQVGEQLEDSQEEFHQAKEILQEKKGKYLIQWEGIDPNTNEPYAPTWEPKANANKALVDDWKESQKAKKASKRAEKAVAKAERQKRTSRVVASSSVPSTPALADRAVETNGHSVEETPQQSSFVSPDFPQLPELDQRLFESPFVQVTQGSDFDPDEYERFSQLPTTQTQPSSSQAPQGTGTPTSYTSHTQSEPTDVDSGRIIPDSQSLPGDSTFVPSTQAASGSNQKEDRNQDRTWGNFDQRGIAGTTPTTATNTAVRSPSSSPAPVLETDPIEDSSALPRPYETPAPPTSTEQPTQVSTPSPSPKQTPEAFRKEHNLEIQPVTVEPAAPNDQIERRDFATFLQPDTLDSGESQVEDQLARVQAPTREEEQETLRTIREEEQFEETQGSTQGEERPETLRSPAQEEQSAETELPVQEKPLEEGSTFFGESRAEERRDSTLDEQEQTVQTREISSRAEQAVSRVLIDIVQASSIQRESPKPAQKDQEVLGADKELENSVQSSKQVEDQQAESQSQQQQEVASSLASQEGVHHFQEGQIVPSYSFDASTQDESANTVRQTTELVITIPQEHIQIPSTGSDNEPESAQSSQIEPSSPWKPIGVSTPTPRQSSSPIRRAPSYSPYTLGSSSIRRHYTPQSYTTKAMEMPKGLTLMERQARHKQNFAAQVRPLTFGTASPGVHAGTRSPSTIPDRVQQQPAQPTSLRTTALTNSAQQEMSTPGPSIIPASALLNNSSDASDPESFLLDTPQLEANEYLIALSMQGRQKSQYKNVLKESEVLISEFTKGLSSDSVTVEKVRGLLKKIHAVENHMDLLNSEAASQDVAAEMLANWAIETSEKFRFLGLLFENLRAHDLHIALLAEPGQLLDIAEGFIKGKHLRYEYPNAMRRAASSSVFGQLWITLIPTHSEGFGAIIQPADLIICLDSTADPRLVRKTYASHPNDRARIAPLIRPMIVKSSEHIDQCISSNIASMERLRALVVCIAQLRQDAGKMPMNYLDTQNSAAEVARFLISEEGNAAEWPLPFVDGIKDFVEFESQSTTSADASRSRTPTQEPAGVHKRTLDVEPLDPSKKMRLTPQAEQPPQTVNPAELDLTTISDSLGPSQQPDVPTLQENLSKMQIELEDTRSRLEASVKREQELEKAFDKRQNEYQDLRERFGGALVERDEANRRAEYAIKQKDVFQERLAKRDEEIRELKLQAQTERDANLSSADVNVAELTRLRAALAEAEEAKEKAQKSSISKEKDLDYFREVYQQASNSARDLADANTELEKENELLKKQASGNAVKLKQMGINANHAALEQQVKNLKIQVETRQRLLTQKEEEIKTMKGAKGLGMGTRAASVPRSPRVGGANPTSRGASPLPGSRLGTLRNG